MAKPNLCRSCKHYLTDGCEICGCGDYVESDTIHPAPVPGNAAAMREALENIRLFVGAWLKCGEIDKSMAESIFMNCDAALAATARNCDRFATLDDALKAHCVYCERRQTPQPHCLGGRDMMSSDCLDCFAEWLFDKAEGGAE